VTTTKSLTINKFQKMTHLPDAKAFALYTKHKAALKPLLKRVPDGTIEIVITRSLFGKFTYYFVML